LEKKVSRKSFIEPLPKHKTIAFVVILGIGIAMLMRVASFSPQGFVFSLFQGLGTSFIAVALVDLIPEMVRRIQEVPARRRIAHFFGKEGIKNGFHLVSAERTVERKQLQHLYAPGAPERFRNTQEKTMSALPEGVRSWLAEQDIRAVSYIAKLFGEENIGFVIGIDTDQDKRLAEMSLITFGLGFNGCTNRLADLPFDGPGHLFRVDWEKSSRDLALGTTDALVIGGKKVDLSEDDMKKNDVDYALVARIVARPNSGHVQFVCAGRTANGTAVAGYFLAHKWQELASKYKDVAEMDTDSLAVIIQHTASSQPDAFDLDSSGKICKQFGIVKARCTTSA
jgi:hypothetical protein